MTAPAPEVFFTAMEATWPAAETCACGPFRLRRGEGGGKRVSSAIPTAAFTEADIAAAEAAMRGMGQPALFMIGEDAAALDAALAARGYRIVDPVVVLAGPVARVAMHSPPAMACFAMNAPLAIMRALWDEGGIGPARLAVMERVTGPKSYLFARHRERPAGVGFVALAGRVAMLHALYVPATLRRQGVARNILGRAAEWAQNAGAEWFSAVTIGENLPARQLFSGLGMQPVAKYHYRLWITQGPGAGDG